MFPWKVGQEVINESSVGRARTIFGIFIGHAITDLGLTNPVLVPVPSKDGLIGAATFRSLDMLREALVGNTARTVAPALRFTEQLQPAHAGGLRGREALAPYLQVVPPFRLDLSSS